MICYGESDLKENLFKAGLVAVLGYGNQGHAHALNIRESGGHVVVGARAGGQAWQRAKADGFKPVSMARAVGAGDCIALLLPDEVQGEVFQAEVVPNLKSGATLVFAHGFTITFGLIDPPEGHDVILVAPKGQGHYMRELYMEGKGLPCLIAVERDFSGHALQKALSYASLIGCLSAGAIETNFREETVTDLFGEQVVLCGGVPELVRTAFETLVRNGYRPEIAYLECLHELKIIADLMHREGIASMKERISKTAAWGSFVTGREVISDPVRVEMEKALEAIESGGFARQWMKETGKGQKRLKIAIENEYAHPIEEAGKWIRALMPYLKEKQDKS